MLSYGDVAKPVNDFFKKSFVSGHSATVKASTDAGCDVTASGTLSDGSVSTSLKAEGWKHGAFTAKKFEIGSSGSVAMDFKLSNIVDGADLKFAATDATRVVSKPKAASAPAEAPAAGSVSEKSGATVASLGIVAKRAAFAVDASVDFVTGPIATVSATVGRGPVVLGAKVVANSGVYKKKDAKFKKGFDLQSYDVLAAYREGNSTFGVEATSKFSTFKGFVSHKAGDWTLVGQASLPRAAPKAAAKDAKAGKGGASVDFGATCKVADDVAVFGAISSSGKVRLAYKLDVGKSSKLSVAADIDARNIGDDKHSFGTKLELRA